MESMLDIINSGIGIATNAKAWGAIATLAAVIKLLMDFSKTLVGQKLLEKLSAHHKWLRPLVASALGFLAGALGALAMHKPWATILMAGLGGVGAAFAGIGAHEVVSTATAAGRERRAASAAVEHALSAGDDKVKEHVESLKAELDKAAAMPDRKARLAALAAWAKAHPPARSR